MEASTVEKGPASSYAIISPTGEPFEIPNTYDPDTDLYAHMTEPEDIRSFYRREGYVIQRSLIPAELCATVMKAFQHEVKPFKGYLYRQATSNPEKHALNDSKFMINAVMNIQDLETKKFGNFQRLGMDILTHPNMKSTLNVLMQEEAIIAQTMYFEGNPTTWPHQDKDYLDAIKPGAMVGAWVALEDIKPGAGRFYVYPKSHTIDIDKIGGNLNIILDKDAYKKFVVDTIRQSDLECTAPALKQGDVLFWHGKTIHGSLSTTQPQYSRSSFTCHYMPVSTHLLQLQVRQKRLRLREVNGMKVNFPKDQNRAINKVVFFVETTFPKVFRKIKKKAIQLHGKK